MLAGTDAAAADTGPNAVIATTMQIARAWVRDILFSGIQTAARRTAS
jgi:hypothetical protein